MKFIFLLDTEVEIVCSLNIAQADIKQYLDLCTPPQQKKK